VIGSPGSDHGIPGLAVPGRPSGGPWARGMPGLALKYLRSDIAALFSTTSIGERGEIGMIAQGRVGFTRPAGKIGEPLGHFALHRVP
jgi:hypothetical protein